jgi:ABC-type glycerol-3-phosphate transport system substrate-binding protein
MVTGMDVPPDLSHARDDGWNHSAEARSASPLTDAGRSRRRTVLGAAVRLAPLYGLTALFGCGPATGGAGGATAEPATGAARSGLQALPASSPARPSLAPASLELWLPGRQADATALEPFHRQLAEETAGALAVTVQLVTNEDMMDRLTAALAGGNAPDVARLKESRLADLGARAALLPLDAYVAQDPDVRLADFTPQSVEGSRYVATSRPGANAGPQLLGVPDSHQLVVLYWNRDLVARAGLNPEVPPANWDDLRRGARAVQALSGNVAPLNAGGGASSNGAGSTGGSGPSGSTAEGAIAPGDAALAAEARGFQFYEFSLREQAYCWFMEWVWRAGGEVWSDASQPTAIGGTTPARSASNPLARRPTLDTPEAARALQFHVDLLLADRTAVPVGTPVQTLIDNVAQGRIGYWMTTANAALSYGRTSPGLQFGVGPMPADRRDAHQLQHNALAIFAASKHLDAAYRMVSFRSRADVQARWAADGAWLPVRPALWAQSPFRDDSLWRAIGGLMSRPGNRTKPVVPEWDAFAAAVMPHLIAAWRGDLSPKEALVRAQQAADTQIAATTP